MSQEFLHQTKEELKTALKPEYIDVEDPVNSELEDVESAALGFFLDGGSLKDFINLVHETCKELGYPESVVIYLISKINEEFGRLEIARNIQEVTADSTRKLILNLYKSYLPQIEEGALTQGTVTTYILYGLEEVLPGISYESVKEVLKDAGLME